jgi:hypothetical protein
LVLQGRRGRQLRNTALTYVWRITGAARQTADHPPFIYRTERDARAEARERAKSETVLFGEEHNMKLAATFLAVTSTLPFPVVAQQLTEPETDHREVECQGTVKIIHVQFGDQPRGNSLSYRD